MRIKLISLIVVLVAQSCQTENKVQNPKEEAMTNELASQPIEETEAKELLKWPSTLNAMAFLKKYGASNTETIVLLKTRLGDIKIKLFEDTPLHRANFIFNTKRKLYEKTIFYRVVPNFMIQGGNSDYKKTLEMRKENSAYYITNEVLPHHIHKRGALAMAMTYTDNPDEKSAQYSYYIVLGKTFDDAVLEATEKEYNTIIPAVNKEIYKNLGGTPHLDGVHTVFGEVVEGMDVVKAISNEKTDSGNWPINDVIISCEVID
jgi:peptidyl-prolyl cis-trans isomerase A (cyclophilin A)